MHGWARSLAWTSRTDGALSCHRPSDCRGNRFAERSSLAIPLNRGTSFAIPFDWSEFDNGDCGVFLRARRPVTLSGHLGLLCI